MAQGAAPRRRLLRGLTFKRGAAVVRRSAFSVERLPSSLRSVPVALSDLRFRLLTSDTGAAGHDGKS